MVEEITEAKVCLLKDPCKQVSDIVAEMATCCPERRIELEDLILYRAGHLEDPKAIQWVVDQYDVIPTG